MEKAEAMWRWSLDVECPNCKEDIDLLESYDIGTGVHNDFEFGEIDTSKTESIEFECFHCEQNFLINLVK